MTYWPLPLSSQGRSAAFHVKKQKNEVKQTLLHVIDFSLIFFCICTGEFQFKKQKHRTSFDPAIGFTLILFCICTDAFQWKK